MSGRLELYAWAELTSGRLLVWCSWERLCLYLDVSYTCTQVWTMPAHSQTHAVLGWQRAKCVVIPDAVEEGHECG